RLELAEELFEYHLVGPLQKNKVNKAVDCFDWVETIDSIELAQRIDRACSVRGKCMPALIQVNLAKEPGKSGIEVENLTELVEQTQSLKNLSIRGLMAIPPYYERPEDVRPFFRRLRELREQLEMRLRSDALLGELSMGMSHDFPVAIEEGATIVRIGTAIFGERVYT
ncbi:MAG TPA: YggS family pyridoxal phosphate-dependent enzyme, partial [Terriglobia bacterium]|nr:YggS family pyridoxal phosphate-dependent enzyme [Terriglobia bacterium]